ncbi:MAG: ABC transporter permease [bacterium]|nr:ABC transporter permease [bacterium]
MISPRWRKVLADIGARPGRSALAVMAMIIGILAVGTMAFKFALLNPILNSMHEETQPASAIFYLDRVDDELVTAVQNMPEIGQAEVRPIIMARLNPVGSQDGDWIPAILYVLRDFEQQRLNLVLPDGGAWPPGPDEILLERTAVEMTGARLGDQLRLNVPGIGETELQFSGNTYAAGLSPAWMEHSIYGFIGWNSMLRQNQARESAQLLVQVASNNLETGHINEVVDLVKTRITDLGYNVRRVKVPPPGKHPHARQMNTFLYLLTAFAALTFLLGSVLVANMIHTLQGEQIKQVGMMKAIGASSWQISGIYLTQIGLLVASAMAIGLPLSWFTGKAFATWSAALLNADLSEAPFPSWVMFQIIGMSLVVPLLVAMLPLWRSSRISVREALAHDSGARPFGSNLFERKLTDLKGISRPLALILRTTLQRRTRLALTVGMLAVGGAVFMAAINVSLGWNRSIDEDFLRREQDLTVWFAEPQPVQEMEQLIGDLSGVKYTESWSSWSPYLVGKDGIATEKISAFGVVEGSTLFEPELIAGSWLDQTVPDGIVLNNSIVSLQPSLAVGDSLTLRLGEHSKTFPIVGIIRELVPVPLIYTNREIMLATAGLADQTTRSVHIVTTRKGPEAQLEVAGEVERVLAEKQVVMRLITRQSDIKGAVVDHLKIIQVVLLLAAGIVVMVGGLGLSSALVINVLQRTREFGIMSALGAKPRTLASHVWSESVLTAVLSWILAAAIAAPIGSLLGQVTGQMFFKTNVAVPPSWQANLIWLVLVLILGSVTSFYPANQAARLTVRRALDHLQ